MSSGIASMSSSGIGGREWRLFIADMISFAEKVQTYTQGLAQAEFVADDKTYDAVLRNLELLGEAATHIPQSVRDAHAEVPWRAVIGMRNRLIHGYLGIDDELVWSAVRDELPPLLTALRAIASRWR